MTSIKETKGNVTQFPTAPRTEVELILDAIITELTATRKHVSGSGFTASLLVLWLHFFMNLKLKRTPKEIQDGLTEICMAYLDCFDSLSKPPFNNPSLTQLIKLGEEWSDLQKRANQAEELENQLFATESALEQRSNEVLQLKRIVETAKTEIHRLRSQFSQQAESVVDLGNMELAQLTQITQALSRIQPIIAGSVDALTSVLRQPDSEKQPAIASPEKLDQIKSEIIRLQSWLMTVQEHLGELTEERSELTSQIDQEREMVKFADKSRDELTVMERRLQSINLRSSLIIAEERGVKDKLGRLTEYQRAIQTIEAGLPDDLFGSSLPEFSHPGMEDLEDTNGSEYPTAQTVLTHTPENRRAALTLLSQKFRLRLGTIMTITLYYCMPAQLLGTRKSTAVVIGAASRLNLMEAFGFTDRFEVFEHLKLDAEKTKDLIRYWGSPNNLALYCTTGAQLPWDINDLLTPEEVQMFQTDLLNRKPVSLTKPKKLKS